MGFLDTIGGAVSGAWDATGGAVANYLSGGDQSQTGSQSSFVQADVPNPNVSIGGATTMYGTDPDKGASYFDSGKTAMISPEAISIDTRAPANFSSMVPEDKMAWQQPMSHMDEAMSREAKYYDKGVVIPTSPKMSDLGIQPLGPKGSEGLMDSRGKGWYDMSPMSPPQLPPMSLQAQPLPSYSAMDISRNSHPVAMDIPLPPKSMDAIPSFGGRGYSDALVGFGTAPKGSGETIGGNLQNIGLMPLDHRGTSMIGVYRKSKPTYSFLKRTPEKQTKQSKLPPKIKQDLKSIINIEVINKNVIPKSLGKGFATVISPDKLVKSMGAHTKVKGSGKVKTDALGLTNIKNITGNINIPGFGANLTKSKSGNFGMVGNIDDMLKGIISPVKIKKIKLK